MNLERDTEKNNDTRTIETVKRTLTAVVTRSAGKTAMTVIMAVTTSIRVRKGIMITASIADTGIVLMIPGATTVTMPIRGIAMIIAATGGPGRSGTGTPKNIRKCPGTEITTATQKRT